MIVDTWNNIGLYTAVHPDLQAVITSLRGISQNSEPGKYPVSGTDSFYLVQRYSAGSRSEKLWEAHRRYIDLQLVVSGEEYIGYAHLDDLALAKEYDPEGDASFHTGEGTFLPLQAGKFMLLFPEDAHMPGVECKGADKVVKVVAKLPVL